MAKYSTGGSSGGGEGEACELCGATSDSLREAEVAGARLQVCPDCAPHDDAPKSGGGGGGSSSDEETQRRKRAAQNAAKGESLWDGDTSHWEEEGTGYDEDPLPYLVTDYGERFTEARQDAGYQLEEFAEEVDAEESDLLAVEQGRAARAGVGGSLIARIEDALDIELTE